MSYHFYDGSASAAGLMTGGSSSNRRAGALGRFQEEQTRAFKVVAMCVYVVIWVALIVVWRMVAQLSGAAGAHRAPGRSHYSAASSDRGYAAKVRAGTSSMN